jgi:5-methylcytosine-specific restriction endonuclease McrA
MAIWPYNTQRWQRLRRMKLRVNPLCELCLKQNRIVPAVAVDHIVPVKAPGGEAFPALDWLMSMCASCHNRKTRGEQLGADLPIKGCDIYGYPLDPRHPWWEGSPLRDRR